MLIPRPALHPMAAAALAEIEAGGRVVSHADALWLHTLAACVSDGMGIDRGRWCNLPLPIGGLNLWPLTLAGEEWLAHHAGPWFAGDRKRELLAIAYAMSEGRKPGAFDHMMEEAEARHYLRQMAKRLHASWFDLSAAIDKVAGVDGVTFVDAECPMQDKRARAIKHDYGQTIALLIEKFGGTVDTWVYLHSAEQVYDLLAKACNRESDGPSPQYIRAVAQFEAAKAHIKGVV